MPGTMITTPCIGASLTQVWKPTGTPGAASDGQAPFALGHITDALVANVPKQAQFVRASAVVANAATAAITAGVFGAAAGAGNTWTNNTGVATVIGDYLWVTASVTNAP